MKKSFLLLYMSDIYILLYTILHLYSSMNQ